MSELAPLLAQLRVGARDVDEATAVDDAETLVVTSVLVPYARLRELSDDVADRPEVIDAAEAIHRLAVRESRASGDAGQGLQLLQQAVHMTPTAQLATEFARMRTALHRQCAATALRGRHYAYAVAHLDLAEQWAADTSEKASYRAEGDALITRHSLGPIAIDACREKLEADLDRREKALQQRVREASGGPTVPVSPAPVQVYGALNPNMLRRPAPAASRQRRVPLGVALAGIVLSLSIVGRDCAASQRESQLPGTSINECFDPANTTC